MSPCGLVFLSLRSVIIIYNEFFFSSLVRQMFKSMPAQLKYHHFLSSFPVTINKAYILQKILFPDNTLGYSGYFHISITRKKKRQKLTAFDFVTLWKLQFGILFDPNISFRKKKQTQNLWAILVSLQNFFKSQMMFITFVKRFIEIANWNLSANWIVHLPILQQLCSKNITFADASILRCFVRWQRAKIVFFEFFSCNENCNIEIRERH